MGLASRRAAIADACSGGTANKIFVSNSRCACASARGGREAGGPGMGGRPNPEPSARPLLAEQNCRLADGEIRCQLLTRLPRRAGVGVPTPRLCSAALVWSDPHQHRTQPVASDPQYASFSKPLQEKAQKTPRPSLRRCSPARRSWVARQGLGSGPGPTETTSPQATPGECLLGGC